MKRVIILLLICIPIVAAATSSTPQTVAVTELGGFEIKTQNWKINNFGFRPIEISGDIFFKNSSPGISFHATATNISTDNRNCTIYVVCLNDDGGLVASFLLMPDIKYMPPKMSNILKAEGHVEAGEEKKISKIVVRVVEGPAWEKAPKPR